MATTPNQQDQNAIDNLNMSLTSVGERVAKNKKVLYWTLGLLIAIGACWCAWLWFYQTPRVSNSAAAYDQAMTAAMGGDSIAAVEFAKVADKYSGTDAGNLAAMQAAQAYYRLGKYQETVKYLDKFSTKEEVLNAQSYVLLGDAYVNLKKYDEALSAFQTAVKKAAGNEQIVPMVLWKEANIYDSQKKYQDALNCFEQIKTSFPTYTFGNGLTPDAYIAREKARLGK
ncbi:MAG: tetratricopeptide repeat protein [Muribaculaceae bacterium]|nr:tetratricopeptide repeat protein [Muribaculaceae bacterium]